MKLVVSDYLSLMLLRMFLKTTVMLQEYAIVTTEGKETCYSVFVGFIIEFTGVLN